MTVKIRTLITLCVLLGVLGIGASSALAAEPWWHLNSGSEPANLPTEGTGHIVVTAADLGDADANGSVTPVRITDTLPPGLKATGIGGRPVQQGHGGEIGTPNCTLATLSCEYTGIVPDYGEIQIVISVEAEPGATESSEVNHVSVSGGGALGTSSVARAVTISEAPTPYGVENYEMTPEEEGGVLDTQAGSHPFQLTTTLDLNQSLEPGDPPALAKDLRFKLPPGLVGNPTPFSQCPEALFLKRPEEGDDSDLCPADTAVGVAALTIHLSVFGRSDLTDIAVPLFNLVPRVGEPARFGFYYDQVPVYLDTSVRTGSDYGVTVNVDNITQMVAFISSRVTFWGVPGDPRHNNVRGWSCIDDGTLAGEQHAPCTAPSEEAHPPPLLALPTSCTGPLQTTVETDSWKEEGVFSTTPPSEPLPALDGCNDLPFRPSVSVVPDAQNASNPSGLKVDVHVPQSVDLDSEGLSASDVRKIVVALPAGVAINPSAGDGLEACSSDPGDLGDAPLGNPGDQIGYKGLEEPKLEPGVSGPGFTPYLPGSTGALAAGDSEPLQPGVNFCANASKIAEVTVHSPDLPDPLTGFVYLAAQESNPFGSLLAMYIVAEDPTAGVLVKLAGEVQLCKSAGEVIAGITCQALGQIITTFAENPQAPFEDAELHFFGGERAPLAMPSRCGAYTTSASFVPWSGSEPSAASSTFDITSGPKTLSEPEGSPCPGASLPFSPSLTGGATNVNAGSFSPLTLTMTRQDGEQNLQSVEAHLPPGLSGVLSNVELCPEPQANIGACGPNSFIGETTVAVGVGGEPFTVKGGKFYLTGPYNGRGGCTVGEAGCAPFGLTFEVPAKAGPFDFAKTQANHPACDCVLVRGKIEINPTTAAVTITSNPPGTPDSIPTSLEGIPLEIQHVNAITTRSDFQFNPTNCSKMEATGTIHSSENATDTLSVPFQVTNCAFLKFTPEFAVSTSGKTSRASGASLSVKLDLPQGAVRVAGEHRPRQSRTPQGTPIEADDAAEGVLHGAVRIKPRGLPTSVDRRPREGDHPTGPSPVGRPSVLRQPRRGSLPLPDHRATGLWREDRPGRVDLHQQSRDHEQHIQDRPRPARRQLRTDTPPRPILRARGERKPLQRETSDADRIRRAERRGDPQEHEDRGHRLPKARAP